MSTDGKPNLPSYRDRMDKAVQALKDEFGGLRTGRANAGLIEHITVDAYGSQMPITQVGAISVPEARMITVSVWDKALVIAVEKAIRNAGIGLNPVTDGTMLRIPIPALTEERRKDLVKLAGKYAETQRIAVRNVRRDAMDELKKAEKDHVISQDEQKKMGDEVQGFTDAAIKRVDEALKIKEQEIMQV
jgi:ribosome recycling factor